MALQSSQRLPELLFYTKKSYRILQLQFYKGTHTPSTSTHTQYNQRILHPESNSTCRRQRALWVLLLHTEGKETFIPERNSTHRRQGDLLDIHPCVTRTFRHSSLSRQFYKFYNVPVFPGNPTHYSILQLECIFYNFYSPIGFHRKLHWVPVERYKHYKHSFFKEREMLRYRSELTYSPE